ncbi:MAG: TIGR00296 family protein [Nanoarchaeota archaeon]|nr:TIGR00296 family protein [Nanoarchaeota archaeon]
MISDEQGITLLKIAREVIDSKFKGIEFILSDKFKEEFKKDTGCFVTLVLNGKLRGCIGYAEPTFPLYKALIDSAKNAAFSDPRFPAITEKEWNKIKVEVTVLSKPELIKVNNPEEYITKIEIGKHGLIIEREYKKGLLLPQVPVEWKWGVKEFLEHTCSKANLPVDIWMDKETKVYWFEGNVFSE